MENDRMPFGFRPRAALIGMLLLANVGCGPRFGFPTFCDPRSETEKLAEAKKFDPYPEPLAGGGDMRGARPLQFIDPRPSPDLLAKQQMSIPSNNMVATPVPPGALPAPPAVYIPSSPSYPPGASNYPPATVIAPPGTSLTAAATPQVVYPASGTSYASGGTNPLATSVYPASATQPITSVGSGAGSTVAPVAYGKALTSP